MTETNKIFDEKGAYRVRFAIDATNQIEKWLGLTSLIYARKFAIEVEDEVFGRALEFPCKMIDP